jgi:hypothetical protein
VRRRRYLRGWRHLAKRRMHSFWKRQTLPSRDMSMWWNRSGSDGKSLG